MLPLLWAGVSASICVCTVCMCVLDCVYVVLFVHPDNSRRDILFILFDDKNSVMKDWVQEYEFRARAAGSSQYFCTSSVKQRSLQTPKTLIFSLQLGVIAVRVEEERVLKSEPPRSLYLPLTRLSCDWIITPLPPGNCRSRTPSCFDGAKNGGRENVSRIITVCRSGLWFLWWFPSLLRVIPSLSCISCPIFTLQSLL